ncbi:MAG: cyanophycinase [Actinomycetota bacterium]
MTGPLALVGGGEFAEPCSSFDKALIEQSGATDVLVLPTGAAYEHPQRLIDQAVDYFKSLGVTARGLMVVGRPDAQDEANAKTVADAKLVYLAGGSALHLRSVLKESAVWDALIHAWNGGAAVAGSSAGAMVLGDPMVDPRGGAFTLGLGLIEQMAAIPHFDEWSPEKAHRVFQLAPAGVPVVSIHTQTALVRAPDGAWSTSGGGKVEVFVDGKKAGLDALPG